MKPGAKRTGEGVDSGKMAPRIYNRRAAFDYFILDTSRVRDCAGGQRGQVGAAGEGAVGAELSRASATGRCMLMGCHIDEYVEANQLNHDPTRTRRLLLHRREIRRLVQRMQKESGGGKGGGSGGGGGKGGGATLIPLEMYFRRGFVEGAAGDRQGEADV